MNRERRNFLQAKIKQLQSELEHEDLAEGSKETCDTQIPMQPGAQIGGYAAQQNSNRDPIDDIFTYHDNPEAVPHYIEIREAAKTFARVINRHTPYCPDKTNALNALRASVMWANAAIALDGRTL